MELEIKTAKQCFEDKDYNILITEILDGKNGMVRITAKNRFPSKNGFTYFSTWITKKYANELSRKRCGITVDKWKVWKD